MASLLIHDILNKYLLVVAALLCGFLGSITGIRADGVATGGQKSETQIVQSGGWQRQMAEEPQSPVEASLRTFPSSYRVASSRPARLLSTHGGRPGPHHGRGTTGGCSSLPTSPRGGFAQSTHASGRAFSSPRLYYVIALRRLLC